MPFLTISSGVLQVLVTLLCRIPANFKMKTQLIDGRKNISNTELTILNGFGNAVGELLVFWCNRKLIKVNQFKKKEVFILFKLDIFYHFFVTTKFNELLPKSLEVATAMPR